MFILRQNYLVILRILVEYFFVARSIAYHSEIIYAERNHNLGICSNQIRYLCLEC